MTMNNNKMSCNNGNALECIFIYPIVVSTENNCDNTVFSDHHRDTDRLFHRNINNCNGNSRGASLCSVEIRRVFGLLEMFANNRNNKIA